MRQKTPPGFCFAAKLTRTLTHEVDPDGWRGQAARYRDGIAPLIQAQQLKAVLVQLPPGFRRSPENRRYLAAHPPYQRHLHLLHQPRVEERAELVVLALRVSGDHREASPDADPA